MRKVEYKRDVSISQLNLMVEHGDIIKYEVDDNNGKIYVFYPTETQTRRESNIFSDFIDNFSFGYYVELFKTFFNSLFKVKNWSGFTNLFDSYAGRMVVYFFIAIIVLAIFWKYIVWALILLAVFFILKNYLD